MEFSDHWRDGQNCLQKMQTSLCARLPVNWPASLREKYVGGVLKYLTTAWDKGKGAGAGVGAGAGAGAEAGGLGAAAAAAAAGAAAGAAVRAGSAAGGADAGAAVKAEA